MEEKNIELLKEVSSKKKEIMEQIKILSEDEKVKEYLHLKSENEKLSIKENQLYKEIKTREYLSCNHLLARSAIETDSHEGRTYKYFGCVKCGLDEKVKYYMNKYGFLTPDQTIMYETIKLYPGNHLLYNNIIKYDFDTVMAIYCGIKKVYPDIDNETAIKYIQSAVHNMNCKKVSKSKKENRVKRLSLNHMN